MSLFRWCGCCFELIFRIFWGVVFDFAELAFLCVVFGG